MMQESHDLEPLSPGSNFGLGIGYALNNQPDAAIAVLEDLPVNNVGMRSVLARGTAEIGDELSGWRMTAAKGGPAISARRHLKCLLYPSSPKRNFQLKSQTQRFKRWVCAAAQHP
jgi:hypothetical protein